MENNMKMEWGFEQECFGDGESEQHLQTVPWI